MAVIEQLKKQNKIITVDNFRNQWENNFTTLDTSDIAYINANYNQFVGVSFIYQEDIDTGDYDAGSSTIEYGLWFQMRTKVNKGEEIQNSELRLFLNEVIKNSTFFITRMDDASEIEWFTKFLENEEDRFFQLVAFDKYKFEEFDKQAVVLLNEYLSTSFYINGLEYAYKAQGGFGVSPFYRWTGDGAFTDSPDLPEEKASKIDSSLFLSYVDDFQKPFDFIKGEEATNNVRFVEDSRFSDLSISSKESDTTAWLDGGPLISIKKSYNLFLIEFLKILNLNQQSQISYDDIKVQAIFSNTLADYLNSPIKFTAGSVVTGTSQDFSFPLVTYIAKKILDDFRYAAWKKYVNELKDLSEEQISSLNGDQLAQQAFGAGEEAALNSSIFDRDPNAPEDDGLTEDEIQERQRFLKQCAIMTRLDEMANEHEKIVFQRAKEKFDSNSVPRPVHYYDGRLYMIKDGDLDQHGIVSKLLLPKASNIQEFLEIEPSTHAYLVPKLRFFKIFQEGSTSKQEEFRFRNFTRPQRVNNLKSIDYDKGGDFGIKEFTFSFEGTTPATAKNDIKANLSLYFQSFDDFINTQPENKSPFVDMLLLPGGSTKKGSGQESPFQFQPEYYRLRVDVGWIIPDKSLEKQIGTEKYNSLLDALRKTNKSFYLNMVDHTIDFRDDGSVQIDVEYRAYIESALKGTILDALASRETREALKKTKEDYAKILKTGICNAKELGQIKRQLAQIEELLKKQTYQSIMNRLIMYDMLYFKKLKTTSANSFVKNGFFTNKVRFTSDSEQPSSATNLKEATKGRTFDYGSDFYNEDINTDKDHLFVNYFYLGDLLYVILDSLYEDDGSYISGFENFKFVLGSLQYEDIFDSQFKVINIASIPISAELFFEWFTENIIKPERNSYPIMFFIRDLLKFLVGEILSETCFKRSLDKKLQFHTTNFIGIDDPLSRINGYSMEPVIDANMFYNSGYLPLVQDDGQAHPISDFTNYIMIYVDTPKLAIEGKNGNKKDDGDIGIYHYQIGKPKGLLKKLKFSKTDMQYIREARFFRNGFDGLMQLANVYSVNLDMIGNTLYYPGMEIYVNPLGFMGAANNNYDPTERNSIANKLGFGGYHLVTSVKSSIGPGKFTTQVTAMFNYSGDGDPAKLVTGTSDQVKKVDEIEEIDNRPKSFKNFCDRTYDKVINVALDVVNNKETSYPGIEAIPTKKVVNDAIANANISDVEADEYLIYDPNTGIFEDTFDPSNIVSYRIKDGKFEEIP